jgi:isoquinoline 1-oxidoreductase beta subunit
VARIGKIARRTFLIGTAAIAGGVAFGAWWASRPYPNPLQEDLDEGEATFNPYVKIRSDRTVTIIVPRAEMGQGVSTTLAALVAEELDVDLEHVTVEHGPASPAYANIAMLEEGLPFPHFDESVMARLARDGMAVVGKLIGLQVTGGSTSTIDAFRPMREAGAAAREALKAATARRLGVPADRLETAEGAVHDRASGRSLDYGEIALEVRESDIPASITLREPSQWRLLGRSQPRKDMLPKITGAPIFGIDVRLPDMVHATVRLNPRLGGPMLKLDTGTASQLPGVFKIVPLRHHLGEGFAVLATTTWHAFRAADAVGVEWGPAPYPPDDGGIWTVLEKAAAEGSASDWRNDGNVEAAFADAARERLVEAEYRVPFLAHACMEPMNATAWLRDGRLDIWAPNQSPTLVRSHCAAAAGISEALCTVHTTHLGGGFGRRGDIDYAVLATLVAAQSERRPVKVTWSREEDIGHDMYRPAALGRFRARLGPDGMPDALDMRIAAPSIMASTLGRYYPRLPAVVPDKTLVDGAFNQPYTIENYRVTGIAAELAVPVGFWRSVGHSCNCFFHECFLDEVAEAGRLDPVELRLKLAAAYPAATGVIEAAAALADWQRPPAAGHARGFAFSQCFGSWVAEVVEISEDDQGIRLEDVWIAADVGLALDPAIIEAQLVSGAIFGFSAAISQEITFADGMVRQSNFHDFDAMRIDQSPRFHVRILQTAQRMGGVGEIGTPAAIAALANAVSRLKGRRMRHLPLSREVTFA